MIGGGGGPQPFLQEGAAPGGSAGGGGEEVEWQSEEGQQEEDEAGDDGRSVGGVGLCVSGWRWKEGGLSWLVFGVGRSAACVSLCIF